METPTGVFIMDGGDRAQGRSWKVTSRILASLSLIWRLAQNGQPFNSPGDISCPGTATAFSGMPGLSLVGRYLC